MLDVDDGIGNAGGRRANAHRAVGNAAVILFNAADLESIAGGQRRIINVGLNARRGIADAGFDRRLDLIEFLAFVVR